MSLGKPTESFPDGFAFPNSTSARAFPPCSEGQNCCTSAEAFWLIHGSVIGLPLLNTTTVGLPVLMMALTRRGMSPTSFKSDTSMCSPVVALKPCHSSVKSHVQVPTTTTAMSELSAADMASEKPDSFLDHRSQPMAYLTVPWLAALMPSRGVTPRYCARYGT